VVAEVAKRDIRQQIVDEHGVRRLREQNLPAVGGGTDARTPVNAQPDVAFCSNARFARVHAHSHSHEDAVGPFVVAKRTLCVQRSRDRILRAREHDEERVALRVDLAAVRCGERLTQQPMVVEQDPGVGVAQPLQERSRSLDVRKEEGQRSVRELCRHVSRKNVSTARTRRW
jgi:hypothetical protein